MLKLFGLIIATAILIVLLVPGRSSAQVSASLQADVTNLRSQVSQLRSEVAQLRTQRGGSAPANSQTTPRRARSVELTDDQIIDRLAILAIEAKDRLNALERRVGQLEKQVK